MPVIPVIINDTCHTHALLGTNTFCSRRLFNEVNVTRAKMSISCKHSMYTVIATVKLWISNRLQSLCASIRKKSILQDYDQQFNDMVLLVFSTTRSVVKSAKDPVDEVAKQRMDPTGFRHRSSGDKVSRMGGTNEQVSHI